MTTPNIENIIKSLVVNAGVMEMGEKIAWGSDTALMRQAAAALQTQAERIKELEAALEKLARLGNGERYGNSDGNMIARGALSKYKGAK